MQMLFLIFLQCSQSSFIYCLHTETKIAYKLAFSRHASPEWLTQFLFVYTQFIYTAGYLSKKFRLSTLLKSMPYTTATPQLGIEPVTFELYAYDSATLQAPAYMWETLQ